MQIRTLEPGDAARFQHLRLLGLQQDPLAFAASFEEERDTPLTQVARRLQPSTEGAVVGAFVDDELVGITAWWRDASGKLSHKAYVWGVFVDAAHRGQGVARQLMCAVIEQARHAPGLRQLNLTVYAANEAARALYASLGFVVYGHESEAVCVGGVLHDDVHMVLRL